MQIFYEPADRLAQWQGRDDVLGVVCYGATPERWPWSGVAPRVSVPLTAPQADVCEILTAGRVQGGVRDGVRYAHDGDWLFAAIEVADTSTLQADSAAAYGRVLRLCREQGYPYLIRAWQYFPEIHCVEEGLERYRQFNRGRHEAFRSYLAQGAPRPAATCIGSARGALTIHVLARALPGVPIENPRQLPAYCYPETYGPRPPDFARAMAVDRPGQGRLLWISGTAAIVGHASQAPGDLAAQTRETFTNLATVLAAAEMGPEPRVLATKIYMRAPAPLGALPPPWDQSAIMILQGNICRLELTVEIEAVVQARC